MNRKSIFRMVAVALIASVAIVSCDKDKDKDSGKELSGGITISPASATIGTVLTATYSGNETVSYQWNREGNEISGAASTTYTPNTKGNYTVTVSATGYKSKTSTVVVVTDESNSEKAMVRFVKKTPGSRVISMEITSTDDVEDWAKYSFGTEAGESPYFEIPPGFQRVSYSNAEQRICAVEMYFFGAGKKYTVLNNGGDDITFQIPEDK